MTTDPVIPAQSGASTLVLVGNPNVGKSLLFRNLTQRYVTVSNYPGTTVEVFRAGADFNGREWELIDTPGLNDLREGGEEAAVTLRALEESPDATVIQVADAKNLRRALFLTLQIAELGRPMVLVLNMYDELDERGGRIDVDRLSKLIGVPVVRSVAPTREGTPELIEALAAARVPEIAELPGGQQATGGPAVESSGLAGAKQRLATANAILAETYSISPPPHPPWKVRVGFWAMHPAKGMAFLAVILFAVYWLVGLIGAGTMVDAVEVGLFEQRLNPLIIRGVDAVLPFPHAHDVESVELALSLPVTPVNEVDLATFARDAIRPTYQLTDAGSMSGLQSTLRFLHDFLVGPYGLVTMALTYAFAIVFPIVTMFFLVFGVLEDSGYFPRMAIMLNRSFRAMGLNGKAVLPMILGLGCTTMATMTTRVLQTRKERVITTMLLALAVPCSAQLGVLLALMAALSPPGVVVWLGLVVAIILGVGWLTARVFPGERSDFILEIPPMRQPTLANVWTKMWTRLTWYLREVIPIFVVGTAVLFMLDWLNLLERIARAGRPVVEGWLGLPSEMANAFLVGFMRRDFGAVYILDAVSGPGAILTPHQILVAMVTITLFMPCFATLLMVAREHGTKVAVWISAFIFPFAFLVGGLVHHVGRWLQSM
jgi:ferrous iron transport protein B